MIYFIAEKPAKVEESVSRCSGVRLSSRLKTVTVLNAQRRLRTNKQPNKFAAWGHNKRSLQHGHKSALPVGQSVLDNKKLLSNDNPVPLPMVLPGSSAASGIVLVLEGLTNGFEVY